MGSSTAPTVEPTPPVELVQTPVANRTTSTPLPTVVAYASTVMGSAPVTHRACEPRVIRGHSPALTPTP